MNPSPSPNDPWVVFDYEVDMFRNLCQLLAVGSAEYQSLSHYIKNAIVESAILHTRILVDILLSRGSQPDDITLSGLAPTLACTEIDELRQSYGNRSQPNSAYWAFNKMLAHATGQRTHSFDYSALLNHLAPLINRIVNQVNDQRH